MNTQTQTTPTTPQATFTPTVRPLHEIAQEIRQDHRKTKKNVYFGAVPYLDAMGTLDKLTDSYGMDSARSIVLYALSNLTTWRGETARRIKLELNTMLKAKR